MPPKAKGGPRIGANERNHLILIAQDEHARQRHPLAPEVFTKPGELTEAYLFLYDQALEDPRASRVWSVDARSRRKATGDLGRRLRPNSHGQHVDHTMSESGPGPNMLRFMMVKEDLDSAVSNIRKPLPEAANLKTILQTLAKPQRKLFSSLREGTESSGAPAHWVIRVAERADDLSAPPEIWKDYVGNWEQQSMRDVKRSKGQCLQFVLGDEPTSATPETSTSLRPQGWATSSPDDRVSVQMALTDLLERAPFTLVHHTSSAKRTLLRAAVALRCPHMLGAIREPAMQVDIPIEESSKMALTTQANYLSPSPAHQQPALQTLSIVLPLDRASVNIMHLHVGKSDLSEYEAKEFPIRDASDRNGFTADEQRHAARLMFYIHSQIDGSVLTEQQAVLMRDSLLDRLQQFQEPAEERIYADTTLLVTKIDWNVALRHGGEIRASDKLQADVAPFRFPSIRAPQECLTRVAAKVEEVWQQTGNISTAWESACRQADLTIKLLQMGEDTTQGAACMCSTEEAMARIHPCDNCGFPTVCAFLKPFDRRRHCRQCFNAVTVVPRSEQTLKNYAMQHLDRALRYEHNILKKKFGAAYKGNLAKERAETYEVLLSKYAGTGGWWCIYSKEWIQEPTVMARTDANQYHGHPQQMSYDGLYPTVSIDGIGRYHEKSNMAFVKLWYNQLKGVHLPQVLKLIHDLRECPPEDTVRRRDLIVRLHGLHLIVLQTGHAREERVGIPLSDSEYAMLRRQYETGIIDHEACARILDPWRLRGHVGFVDPNTRGQGKYDPDKIRFLETIIVEIENRYPNKKLPRVNGVPCPVEEELQPRDWSWSMFLTVFRYLHSKLRDNCDNHYMTTCTIESLLLTCIIQFLDPEFEEWLGLPYCLYSRHPLQVSIGKIVHGLAMRDGWPHYGEWTCLGDWDKSECNIQFETWASNSAKNNFEVFGEVNLDDLLVEFGQLPPDNPPYWTAVLPPHGELPDIVMQAFNAPILTPIASTLQPRSDARASTSRTAKSAVTEVRPAGPRQLNAGHNLTNAGNSCYMSAPVHLLLDVDVISGNLLADSYQYEKTFKIRKDTGRSKKLRHDLEKGNWAGLFKRQDLCDLLRTIIDKLVERGQDPLPVYLSQQLWQTCNALNKEWENRSNDAADFFVWLVDEVLDVAADRSEAITTDVRSPSQQQREQDNARAAGQPILPLLEDFDIYREAYASYGHRSSFNDRLMIQFAQETMCSSSSCPSPYSRSYTTSAVMFFQLADFAEGSDITISGCLKQWAYGDTQPRTDCLAKNVAGHGLQTDAPVPTRRSILKTGDSLVFRFQRDVYGGEGHDLRPVLFERDLNLDISQYCEALPSEEAGDSSLPSRPSVHRHWEIASIVQYRDQGKHYVTHRRARRSARHSGPDFWVEFDDSHGQGSAPTGSNPTDRKQGYCEYMVVYRKKSIQGQDTVHEGQTASDGEDLVTSVGTKEAVSAPLEIEDAATTTQGASSHKRPRRRSESADNGPRKSARFGETQTPRSAEMSEHMFEIQGEISTMNGRLGTIESRLEILVQGQQTLVQGQQTIIQMIQPATTRLLQGPTPQQQPQEAEQFGRSTAQQQRSPLQGPAPRQHPQEAQQGAQQQRQPLQSPAPRQHPQQAQQGGLPAAQQQRQPLQGPAPRKHSQQAQQGAQQQRQPLQSPAPRQHPQQAQQGAQQQRQPLQGPTPQQHQQQHQQQTHQGGMPAAQQQSPGYRPYVESPNLGQQQARLGERPTAQQQHQQQGHGPYTAIPNPGQKQATVIPTPGQEQGQARAGTQRGGHDAHRTVPPRGPMSQREHGSQRGRGSDRGRGSRRGRERGRGGDFWRPPSDSPSPPPRDATYDKYFYGKGR